MPNEKIFVILPDTSVAAMLERAALKPAGFDVTLVSDLQAAETLLKAAPPDLVILGDYFPGKDGLEFGGEIIDRYPALPVIMLAMKPAEGLALQALRRGFIECLLPPLKAADVVKAVAAALQRRKRMLEWVASETRRGARLLQRRLEGLEALQGVGRSVTSLLDLDAILTTVVDAAVDLTGAEEGSLLLLDEATGDLYMRAARNFQDDFVRKFRLPIRDSLAGQVVRTGKPLTLNEDKPQKIKTAYLVHTLVYVPLQVHGRVIGVLGVDNRRSGSPFMDEHLLLVSALADYAAIAIENAKAYNRLEVERNKLETILTRVEDAVIVVDDDARLVLMNHAAQAAFAVQSGSPVNRPVREVIGHTELLEIFDEALPHPSRCELSLEDGRVFSAQVTPIPEVGRAVIMQDITYLKDLDRIKSEFVSTVSHDLRSPLTAILGYVELIERIGPVTDQQRDFIHRVQLSVRNITSLINDLLDLGRIEAGFDSRKEIIPLGMVVKYAVDGVREQIAQKEQHLVMEIPADLPTILGNPGRIRQVIDNLLLNANKFTPKGGKLAVRARSEAAQVILEVVDNGPGIPPADQPYVFDKFYRGSNVASDTPGTGLGLAIVKSIVENHRGRIWVNSTLGQGSVFTVVLPVSEHLL